jgi:hypothetical protein
LLATLANVAIFGVDLLFLAFAIDLRTTLFLVFAVGLRITFPFSPPTPSVSAEIQVGVCGGLSAQAYCRDEKSEIGGYIRRFVVSPT